MKENEAGKSRREELNRQYQSAFQRISDLLFTVDPIGINFGVNTDEYDLEVGTILPRLRTCHGVADVKRVVEEEFSKWFGASADGKTETCREIARRIWEDIRPDAPALFGD